MLDNDTLNERLEAISDAGLYGFDAFGGKAIPYFGWWWRPVDFDADHCVLGVIEEDGKTHVGFDESGKDFGQGCVRVDGEEWQAIKRLASLAAEQPSEATLRALNEAIQALGEPSSIP